MKTILAVDDSVINLKAIKKLLSEAYKVIAVSSAADALTYLETAIPDLVLLDVMMPEMDGFEMMQIMKNDERMKNIPVIFLTADNDKDKELAGFRMGAMDFIVKPFEPDVVLSRIRKTLELEALKNNLAKEVKAKTKEIESITLQTIVAVADTIDSKDKFSKGHSIRVARIAEEIAKRLGWDDDRVRNIYYVGLLHDIGKIGLPDSIFNKADRYTKEEYDLVKRHIIMGADILDGIPIENAKEGAKYHHEHYDGTGYIEGIIGEAIPIEARILALGDAYDAMTHDRAYRKKLTPEKVREEIVVNKGKQFDPALADIMLEMIDDGYAAYVNEDTFEPAKGLMSSSASLLQRVMMEYAVEAKTEANKDALTGLWNRKYTSNEVNRMLSQAQPKGTVFMMDIDSFKGINDRYGHIVGDEILIKIADVLKDIVRQNDIACRIGGDEFLIYFNELDNADTVRALATRILKALNSKVRLPINNNGIGASIGIAMAPVDGDVFDKLYANADKALYHAKNNGKNGYHFYSSENEHETGRYAVQEDLDYIRKMLSEQEPIVGSYYVEYESFKNISRFIRRNVERKSRDVVYILFTLSQVQDQITPVEELSEYMDNLEGAIKESLRIGDVSTRYSSTQMVVILMDTNLENAKMVANRIFSDFLKKTSSKDIELHYDLQKLGE